MLLVPLHSRGTCLRELMEDLDPLKVLMFHSGCHKELQTMVDLLQRYLKLFLLRFLCYNLMITHASKQEPFPLEQEKNKAASLIN